MITRKLDSLGRIVLPKSFRDALALKNGDNIAMLMVGDDVILRRNMAVCFACGSQNDVQKHKKGYFCCDCRERLSDDSSKLRDNKNEHQLALS